MKLQQIIYLPPSELRPYLRNPRYNDGAVDAVRASIREFGFRNPILADGERVIIAGHTRWKAALAEKLAEVPVIICGDLSPAQVRALRIADNKTGDLAEWDVEKLLAEFAELPGMDWEQFGFSAEEMEEWQAAAQPEFVGQTDPDEIPEEGDIETRCQPGDLWQLGRHRLLCGDATNPDDVERLMGGEKADCLITDPPYGVDYSGKNEFLNAYDKGNRIQIPIENDAIENYREFFGAFLSLVPLADYNTFYVFMSGKELHNLRLAMDDAACVCGDYLVWVKNNHVLGRKDYNSKHEFIVYGWKGKHKFYGDFSTTILNFDRPQKSELHPTMKPVELVMKIMKDGSASGGLIIDCFLGSGSTLIAAEKTGRSCYGMEIEPKYCDVILQRWENFTGQKAELMNAKDLKGLGNL